MTSSTRIAILAALIVAVAPLAACTSAYGRHNPTVAVEIRKAPRLGLLAEEVVFAPPELSPPPGSDEGADAAVSAWLPGHDVTAPDSVATACRAELVLALTRGLVQSGIRVANYGNHDGADAMIEVDVTDCNVQPGEATVLVFVDEAGAVDNDSIKCRGERRLDFTAAYRIVDLSNESEARSGDLDSEHSAVDESSRCPPAYRRYQTMLEQAYSAAVQTIVPLFLETVEERSLVFFDEDRCGMKVAHEAVAAGDYERALELSLANAEHCRIDPEAKVESRDVAAANYNVGILYRIMGDLESAAEHLARASEIDPENDVIAEAIGETRSAAEAEEELRRLEQEATDRAQQLPQPVR